MIFKFIENPEIEVSCEYQKSLNDNSKVSLRTKKLPLISEKINFNNEIIRFFNINMNEGIMNFYIMINYRKIRSKFKTKENYLKISLKEVGNISPKKYSSIIVNDIKMDFSISLSKTISNINQKKPINKTLIKKESKINIMKIKSEEIRKNNIKNDININNKFTYIKPMNKEYMNKSSFFERKKTEKPRMSKTPLENKVYKAIKKVKFITDIKNKNNHSTDKINKKAINTINNANEIHEPFDQEDNYFIQQNYPYAKKKTILLEKDKEKIIIKENNQIINPENNNLILLSNIITSKSPPIQKNSPKKENAISKTEEIFLEPKNYEEYIIIQGNKIDQETFCEGFFIASFPKINGQVIQKSQSFPALCGHKECSSLPSMKSEIIYRYPLKDTKTLELNNLAATICFPTGIKVCYNKDGPELINDYVTRITNQKGERYYMITFHYYLKKDNYLYGNEYEMHPLKEHFRRFADDYLDLNEKAMNKEKEKIEKDLEKAQDLGSRDFVYIPFCLCLISKYSYVDEMKKCLKSIFYLMKENNDKNLLNNLIMHLINSVPIPEIETAVQFYIPYNKDNEIILKYPKLNDLNIMNSSISNLLKYFSIDLIIVIIRLLLFEKKILFIDDDYTLLSNVTDNFISLLYPFQWMHTYIPIMSDDMMQYLETFLPFINGINITLLPLVKELYKTGDMEQNEEIFLVYIKENKLNLGSNLIKKNLKKKNKYKYVEENVPSLPNNLEKELKKKLKKIKDDIEHYEKKNSDKNGFEEFDIKIRVAFMEMFVQMFHDIDKYLVLLDEDIVFNKNYFLEKINKEDKKFYDEFIDTQLFQMLTQNFIKDEFNYFKIMIEDYNKNDGKFIYDEEKAKEQKIFQMKKKYIIPPYYLNIQDKNTQLIKNKINQNFSLYKDNDKAKDKTNNDIKENKNTRIIEYMQEIDEKKYDYKNLSIYIIPKELEYSIHRKKATEALMSNILQNSDYNNKKLLYNTLKKYSKPNKIIENEMNEKEKDELKERIKDFIAKIFKSENIDSDNKNNNSIVNYILNDINTNIGREFFVNLLSKNSTSIILLKDDSYTLLGNVIFNTILYIIPLKENDKILEETVKLIKSLKYFAKEDSGQKNKGILTLWDLYKSRLNLYPKTNQENFWNKWYQINLADEKKDKNKPETKKKIILDLLFIMLDIELDNSFIKKALGKINKKVFEKNEAKQDEIIKTIQEIISKKNKK